MKNILFTMLAITFLACSNSGTKKRDASNSTETAVNVSKSIDTLKVEGFLPQDVTDILVEIAKVDSGFNILKLDAKKMSILNAFAAEVSGDPNCQVLHIDGCHSCYLKYKCRPCGPRGERECGYEEWGNIVKTTCGYQCWHCSFDRCI